MGWYNDIVDKDEAVACFGYIQREDDDAGKQCDSQDNSQFTNPTAILFAMPSDVHTILADARAQICHTRQTSVSGEDHILPDESEPACKETAVEKVLLTIKAMLCVHLELRSWI